MVGALMTSFLAAALMAAGSMAHIVINTPIPFDKAGLQVNPLGGKFTFPCSTQNFDRVDVAKYTVGEDQDLKFTGSAVHGGGTCQLSITYEHPPPADKSKWRVIQTIQGGCPSSAAGNIPTVSRDAFGRETGRQCNPGETGDCLTQFKFKLPQGLPNGDATFAWTWFNNIGNREMYMNCAAIHVAGGSNDPAFFNSLPELFAANIPGQCTTGGPSGILGIPGAAQSPGFVKNMDAANLLGTCSAQASTGSALAAAPSLPLPPPPTNAAVVPVPLAPVSPPSTGQQQTPAPPLTAVGKCADGRVPCNPADAGKTICANNGAQWGTCDTDACMILSDVALGTRCVAGGFAFAKRGLRFRRALDFNPTHAHGHAHHARPNA